jgi:hypothetical protein
VGAGDYGLESFSWYNSLKLSSAMGVEAALVAGYNDTDFYQGFVGLGVNRGWLGSNLSNPFITQLAETYGYIPSHSYGYSAGASYGMIYS